jgi:hypothetical protein
MRTTTGMGSSSRKRSEARFSTLNATPSAVPLVRVQLLLLVSHARDTGLH